MMNDELPVYCASIWNYVSMKEGGIIEARLVGLALLFSVAFFNV